MIVIEGDVANASGKVEVLALRKMAGAVAHRLNNALSPAILYVGLLEEMEAVADPRVRVYVQGIRKSLEAAGRSVTHLREFARRSAAGEADPRPVSLNQIAEEAAALARESIREGGDRGLVEIRLELQPGGIETLGSPEEIREAVRQLAQNGLEAMPRGGRLTLRTRAEGPPDPAAAALEVVDTGPGIATEVRRRCLDPFYTTKGSEAAGLGLTLVAHVMERHGGRLDLESFEGRGTTARLRFPLCGGPSPARKDA